MPALYRSSSIRDAESRELDRLPSLTLMDRAASALADTCTHVLRGMPRGAPVIALIGPGNNGGDALLAALKLRDIGFDAQALMLTHQAPSAPDARTVWDQAQSRQLPLLPELTSHSLRGALFIDGLFGVGLSRPIEGRGAGWIRMLNASGARVMAADLPSGIDADTGAIVGGAGACAILAQHTVTFLADKPGLRTGAGRAHAGQVHVAKLGVEVTPSAGTLVTQAEATALAAPLARRSDSHKGTYGHAAVVGGGAGMQGAAVLAALGAQRAGAGKVSVGSPMGLKLNPGVHPQLMTLPDRWLPEQFQAVVMGCGLGQSKRALAALKSVLGRTRSRIVIDADALNLLAANPALVAVLTHRVTPSVLTPHPLEAARLLGCTTADVQADRIAAATTLAARMGSVVVLKGAGTVCADAAGHWAIIDSGSPALATAATGDVLAGVIGGLLAQGLAPAAAALLGAWIHGRAGEIAAVRQGGDIGMPTSELPVRVSEVLNQLLTAPDAHARVSPTGQDFD